jgi:hypothetical protein
MSGTSVITHITSEITHIHICHQVCSLTCAFITYLAHPRVAIDSLACLLSGVFNDDARVQDARSLSSVDGRPPTETLSIQPGADGLTPAYPHARVETYAHAYAYAHTHARARTHTHPPTHTHTHTHTHAHTHTQEGGPLARTHHSLTYLCIRLLAHSLAHALSTDHALSINSCSPKPSPSFTHISRTSQFP